MLNSNIMHVIKMYKSPDVVTFYLNNEGKVISIKGCLHNYRYFNSKSEYNFSNSIESDDIFKEIRENVELQEIILNNYGYSLDILKSIICDEDYEELRNILNITIDNNINNLCLKNYN